MGSKNIYGKMIADEKKKNNRELIQYPFIVVCNFVYSEKLQLSLTPIPFNYFAFVVKKMA